MPPLFPNFPEFPKTWDMLLFVVGIGLIYFNQGNKSFVLLGILFLGVGIIIALLYPLATMTLPKYPSDDEVKEWIWVYVSLTGIILFFILFLSWIFIKM